MRKDAFMRSGSDGISLFLGFMKTLKTQRTFFRSAIAGWGSQVGSGFVPFPWLPIPRGS